MKSSVRLTQYSSGGGCGCKISPKVLDEILAGQDRTSGDPRLLVGNEFRDDAAAYELEDGNVLLSTTDFFMPIVDDPFDFGRIASANAISDVYAMGGKPLLALAVLGWPLDKLGPDVAREVIAGSRSICAEAGISLAGGHSIDTSEPIFGLAVNGIVSKKRLKTNAGAQVGDLLFLTKPLGVGILATAEKKGRLKPQDIGKATASMVRLNSLGYDAAQLEGVHSITDVTGFGLLGHLGEMCAASGVRAEIDFQSVPMITDLADYLAEGLSPGGARRNWDSYGQHIGAMSEVQRSVLTDPQTSGGLLIAVAEQSEGALRELLTNSGLQPFAQPIGRLLPPSEAKARIELA
ncbi:MAG: selenide, water dikinase SelD [Verrucomicrobiaceae bacterium]|nr:selenide, water dikinase SelD [Verrucomicrobiaceae bacterium]